MSDAEGPLLHPPSGGPSAQFIGLRNHVDTMRSMVKRILLASPRGYCAGVERAVDTVERALDMWGAPVYVRKQIVHNLHVVRDLEERGAIFVESETDVPAGATVVFSAHGVAPSVHKNSEAQGLKTIDATCPLVTKVHAEARHYAKRGYTIVLIGHEGHEEVEGTMGEAPEAIVLVESPEDAETVDLAHAEKLSYITQTTLSVDETNEVIDVLRRRFPWIEAPKKEDICYATTNRQRAVKAMLKEIQLLLVIGSRNSSNSNRLVEVARAAGVAVAPDRRRDRDRRDVARGRRDARRHVGRIRSRAARRPRDRLVPRARRHRRGAVHGRDRGRHLQAPGRNPPLGRGRFGRLADEEERVAETGWRRPRRSKTPRSCRSCENVGDELSGEVEGRPPANQLIGPMNGHPAIARRQQRSGHPRSPGRAGSCSTPTPPRSSGEGWMESLKFEVEPFGIRTTIVEPGFFRTELLTKESTAYADLSIEDYAERTAQTRPRLGGDERQAGWRSGQAREGSRHPRR